ncbi:MAG: hypothetical protein SFW35_12790 [Chitinophagales bacterium]|nr:hypothetical protein [Chitinophagales bacterium]
MKTQYTVTAVFHCPLERAFKAPILGDATKILPGYGVIPPVVGFVDDATWGQVGGHRIPVFKGSLFNPAGPQTFDQILVREENRYWKWQLDQLPWSMRFITKCQGEWKCNGNDDGTISVVWTYTLFSANALVHPMAYLFTKIFWAGLQRQGIKEIKAIAESGEAFLYA